MITKITAPPIPAAVVSVVLEHTKECTKPKELTKYHIINNELQLTMINQAFLSCLFASLSTAHGIAAGSHSLPPQPDPEFTWIDSALCCTDS